MTKAVNFKSGEEMLEYLHTGKDLYCPEIGVYCFEYNEAGAVCSYDIDVYEAFDLMFMAFDKQEYWAAFLGPNGDIWDDPEDEFSPPNPGCSNHDFCEQYFRRDWIDVTVPKLYWEK